MKTKIIFLAFLLLVSAGFIKAQPRFDADINFGYFYENLSPYGEWIQIENDLYGWHPYDVSDDWRPYSRGRWKWTSYGWFWDSFEPFGWATYHYGRWILDDYYGWLWIPDYEWGPSWVEWRYDDDYIGWAPLPPYASFRIGFGLRFSFEWHSPFSHWNFVRFNHFCNDRLFDFFVDHNRRDFFFERTKYRNNYSSRDGRIFNGGIDRNIIERRGGERIREADIRATSDLREVGRNNPGGDSYVRAFRPSNNDVSRARDIEIKNFKRADRDVSIRKDRIAISPSRSGRENANANPSSRSDERESIRMERNNSNKDNNSAVRNMPGSSRNWSNPSARGNEKKSVKNERTAPNTDRNAERRQMMDNSRQYQKENSPAQEKNYNRGNNTNTPQRNNAVRERQEQNTNRQMEKSSQPRQEKKETKKSDNSDDKEKKERRR